MRKFGDLLKELGFNSEAPSSTQYALYRHLIRAAAQIVPETPSEPKPTLLETQLTFDPAILGVTSVQSRRTRRGR